MMHEMACNACGVLLHSNRQQALYGQQGIMDNLQVTWDTGWYCTVGALAA